MPLAPAPHLAGSTRPLATPGSFSVPARHNPRLQAVLDRINQDEELRQLWRCANTLAVERLGLSDHGETHVRIVANASLRLLRLLAEAGLAPSICQHHGLAREDAEVTVVLAAALHDLGLAVHYDNHPEFGLPLALDKSRALLAGIYPVRERTVVAAEVLHAIATHHTGLRCLTLEASILRLADAMDMTKGRSRSPDRGQAAVIDEVLLHRGERRPVRLELRLTQPSGLAEVGLALRERLRETALADQIEAVARIESPLERRVIPIHLTD